MTGRRVAVAACVAAFLIVTTACADRPPAGYDAVAPQGVTGAAALCPDLRGTFDLTDAALAAQFLRQARPDNHGRTMRLTLSGEITGLMRAQWHMDRAEFLADARRMQASDRSTFEQWREAVLSRHRETDPERYVDEVTRLGPVFSIDAGLDARQCQDRWRLVAVRDVAPEGGGNGTPQERQVWLARNAQGALLVKAVLTNVNALGVLGIAPRTGASTTWATIAVAASADVAPITAADLP